MDTETLVFVAPILMFKILLNTYINKIFNLNSLQLRKKRKNMKLKTYISYIKGQHEIVLYIHTIEYIEYDL